MAEMVDFSPAYGDFPAGQQANDLHGEDHDQEDPAFQLQPFLPAGWEEPDTEIVTGGVGRLVDESKRWGKL